MAENPVEFNNCGFEVFLEDIDHHIVCAGAQRIIVELSGDAAHDLVGPAPVAAAGALDAQFARREDGDRLVDTALEPGFEQGWRFRGSRSYPPAAPPRHRNHA